MKRWNSDTKNRARALRKDGLSYGQISQTLNISKSTLHLWIHGIRRSTELIAFDKLRWIKEIQPMGAQANKKRKEQMIKQIIDDANKEIIKLKLSKKVMKIMLVLLYWAEGSKMGGTVAFANTDPRLVLLFITLLRKCYTIDEKKLRVRLHLHYYHRVKKVRKFWSELLEVPEKQFNRIYHKTRSKEKTFRRNYGGICFVRYNSVYLKEQIVQYAYALANKMVGKIDVPVA